MFHCHVTFQGCIEKTWEQDIHEQRSLKNLSSNPLRDEEFHSKKNNSKFQHPPRTRRIFPQNSHPQNILTFPPKTTHHPHFHGKKNGTLRCAPPGNERSCIRYLGQTIHAWNPKHPLEKNGWKSIGSMNLKSSHEK